jgi:hypothetical protein
MILHGNLNKYYKVILWTACKTLYSQVILQPLYIFNWLFFIFRWQYSRSLKECWDIYLYAYNFGKVWTSNVENELKDTDYKEFMQCTCNGY